MQIINKFDKACCKCRVWVKAGEGFAAKPAGGSWNTYCKDHAPERIVARQVITERKLDANGVVTMPYEAANVPLVASMPGAVWNPDAKQWTVSLKEEDRFRVLEIADRLGLNVAPELRELSDATHAVLPDTLYPYQKVGIEWLNRRERGILADDMGLGKTLEALFSITPGDRVMVVCPASLKYNWEAECKKWRPDLNPRVVNAQDHRLPVPRENDVVILNYDILPDWLLKEEADRPAGAAKLQDITLIGDEVHFLTNYKTQRSRKMLAMTGYAKKVLYLTGTLLTKDPKSLWAILKSAGVAEQAFRSWGNYCKLFNARKKSRWGGIEWGEPSPKVPEMLRRVMLRRTREEVLPDLPKKTYTDIIVNGLLISLRNELDAIWTEQQDYLEVEDCLPPFEEFSETRAKLAAAKIPALEELVEQHEEAGIPLVVACDHIAPVDAIGNRPGWAIIKGGVDHQERHRIVEAFQNGTLKGVAMTIKAGGVGITLTNAWKMIMVDLNWTPANNVQCEDRICRIGQTSKTCEIVRLIVDHPLEKHIHKIVDKKTQMTLKAVENLVKAEKLQAPAPPVNGAIKTETPAEYDARMEAARLAEQARQEAIRLAAEEAEKNAKERAEQEKVQRAKSRVEGILTRERARNPRTERPLTPERIDSIRKNIKYMASVCDGAIAKDFQGFNKPDSYMGHVLATAGLTEENELRAAEYILLRYPRQVTLEG